MNEKRLQCSFCCCESNAFGVPMAHDEYRFVVCRDCYEQIIDRAKWHVFEGEAFSLFREQK